MRKLLKGESVKRLIDRADLKKGFQNGEVLHVYPLKQLEGLPVLGERERFYYVKWDDGVCQACPRSFLITQD